MCPRHLAEELAPHLTRPHEPRAEPINPEPKALIERRNREADMVGALHLDVCVSHHAGRSTGKRAGRLLWVGCGRRSRAARLGLQSESNFWFRCYRTPWVKFKIPSRPFD